MAQRPRPTPHGFRHTVATWSLAEGIHLKVVQELLGHSSIVTTLDIYSHVNPDLQHEATRQLSSLLDANTTTTPDEQAR